MTNISALALALVLTAFIGNAALVHASGPAVGNRPLLWRVASWWGVVALVLLVVTRLERLPLASVGWTSVGPGSVTLAGATFLIAFAAAGIAARVLMPALGLAQDGAGAARIAAAAVPVQLAIFATVAVVEELVFRGFVISRLVPLSPVLAVIASVALFTLPHAFGWKVAQLVFVAPLGLVFALCFLWYRDLPACIMAHFLVDAAGFAMMRLAR